MPIQQRLVWLGLAALTLTVPIWFDAVLTPSDKLFFWRWTEQQMQFESMIAIMFLVSAAVGFFCFWRGAKDWDQWPILRIGLWIWVALVTLFVGFSLYMYSLGQQTEVATYEGDRFEVRAIKTESGYAEAPWLLVVMSCDRSALYQRVIQVDRFMGGDDVRLTPENDMLLVEYTNEGRTLHEVTLDLDSLHRQCLRGESPRPEM
ncbi:MAG: hypothetical protein JJU10_06215 [Idiomarina sp.]|nr:hypothetical protein [Idiomarina sp.]